MKKYTKPSINGCILWLGGKDDKGYGQLTYQQTHYSAHRFAWKFFKAELPPKPLQIDHIYRNKLCVNVDHLRISTVTENHLNSIRSDNGGMNKLQCSKGHDLTSSTSYQAYTLSNGRTYKYCVKCRILRRGY